MAPTVRNKQQATSQRQTTKVRSDVQLAGDMSVSHSSNTSMANSGVGSSIDLPSPSSSLLLLLLLAGAGAGVGAGVDDDDDDCASAANSLRRGYCDRQTRLPQTSTSIDTLRLLWRRDRPCGPNPGKQQNVDNRSLLAALHTVEPLERREQRLRQRVASRMRRRRRRAGQSRRSARNASTRS